MISGPATNDQRTDAHAPPHALPQVQANSGRWSMMIGLAGVVLLAVTLRVMFWWLQARSNAVQPGDPEEYYRAALHILAGGYHDTGKWLRPPLYPAFLALMFLLGGVDLSRALLGQALVTGIGTLAFAALGWELFRRRSVALLSALLAAVFLPLAHFGSLLFAEALFVVLIVLALALLIRAITGGRPRVALVCGLVFGLATLTRAVALSFIPLGALLLVTIQDAGHLPGGEDRRPALARRLWSAALLLLGAMLVIGPWTARNYVVHHRLILVDTNGGISMWYGTVTSEQDQRAGEARIFAEPNLADRQSLATRMAIERIAADPGRFLSRMRFKIASLYLLQLRSYAVGDLITISPRGELVVTGSGELPFWPTLIADAQYVLIMLLAIAGLCFAPGWRPALPVVLWVLFGTLLSAVTIGHPRLRLPLVGALIPFAAYALAGGAAAIWHTRRKTQRSQQKQTSWGRRALLTMTGSLVFLALIFSMRYVTWLRGERYAIPARQLVRQGEYAAAQPLFEQAHAADPGNALRLVDLADLAFERGATAEARRLYGAALALEDRNLYAHAMRIQAAELLGRPDLAQAEIGAIRGYGRDNNDLYRWAWGAFQSQPAPRIIPGNPLALGSYTGFAPPTPDLPAGRWTLGDGQLRLRASCGTLELQLQGPPGRVAQVSIEDSSINQALTMDGSRQTLRLPLGSLRDCEFGPPIQVRVRSTTSLLDLERAPWAVGVAVIEAQVP